MDSMSYFCTLVGHVEYILGEMIQVESRNENMERERKRERGSLRACLLLVYNEKEERVAINNSV